MNSYKGPLQRCFSTDASKTKFNVNNHGYPGNTRNVQVLHPCIFCHNNHYNDECDKYSTVTERKKVLSQQKRCFICLKTGHNYVKTMS